MGNVPSVPGFSPGFSQERRAIGSAGAKYVDYAYNVDGSLSVLTTPPLKQINYTYDKASHAISAVDATDSINFVTGATYAPAGELSGATLGSATGFAGFTLNNAYNTRLQPMLLSASSPTATVFSECFDFHLGVAVNTTPCSFSASTLGSNGNVYQIVNNRTSTRSQSFTYDVLNRIASGQSSGSQWGESYTLDAWGNMTAIGSAAGKPHESLSTSVVGTSNQLAGFGYDAAGNMTSNGLAQYVYDAENRLIWNNGTPASRYIYDGNGQRVEKCTAATATTACPTSGTGGTLYFRGTGSDTLDETDLSGNTVEEYIFFNGQRIARRDVSSTGATIAMHYYFSDHLGSHGVVENAPGTACEQDIDYYPYGGVQSDYCTTQVPQRYKFTGKERDAESGLDEFGARYYGSSLGRFMTPDWAASPEAVPYANLEYPQTLNLYSYAGNNPLSRKDADGHFWEELGNLFKYGHYVNNKGLEGALQKDADTARSQIAGMKNFTVNGKSPSDALKGLSNRQTVDLNHSIMNFFSSQVMTSLMGGSNDPNVRVGIVFPIGAAAFEEGAATEYTIQTARGALATDVRTNITAQEFGSNLEANGYTKSVAKDGVTSIYSKGNQVYSIYPNARSTGGAAANLAVDGRVVTKIRLQ